MTVESKMNATIPDSTSIEGSGSQTLFLGGDINCKRKFRRGISGKSFAYMHH